MATRALPLTAKIPAVIRGKPARKRRQMPPVLQSAKATLCLVFSAYVQSDQSMIHSDKDVVLDSAGIFPRRAGKLLFMFIRKKAGTEALPAKNMIFPAGNSVELEIYSTEKLDGTPGTATLNYTDFWVSPLKLNLMDQPTGKSEGVIVGGELGIEGCYYKAIVGDENVVVGCPPVCNAEPPMPQPEPAPVAELTQSEPTAENVAELAQAELPVAQAEVPVPQPEAVLVAEATLPLAEPMTDIYEAPDAGAETVEEAGIVVVLQAEPIAEPAQSRQPNRRPMYPNL